MIILNNTGFKVIKDFDRLDNNMVNEFSNLSTPSIGDVMGRMRGMDHKLKSINNKGMHVFGNAFTVRTHPSDNLLIHKSLDLAKPGDIIVIDGCGDMGNALLGELMCHYAHHRGIKGFIVDGPVRDLNAIVEMDFPVFCKGVSPRGPYREGPGEINTIISCGNVPVKPGDIIVGDDDGVMVVPKEDAKRVAKEAQKIEENELAIIKDIYNDKWPRDWVDKALNEKGCEFIERIKY